MSLNKSVRYTEEQLQKAKEMYIRSKPIREISIATNVPITALHYHIPKWREERELAKSEIISALSLDRKALMSSICKNGLEILAKSMEELNKQEAALSPKEMQGITNIIDSLDKIMKLDPEYSSDKQLVIASASDARKLLKESDPFLEEEQHEVSENPNFN